MNPEPRMVSSLTRTGSMRATLLLATLLSMPLLVVGGALVAWRKATQDAEIDEAEAAFHQLGARVALREAITVPGLEDHVLLVIEKVAPTRAEFPRDPAARRSRPLGGAPPARRDPARESGPPDHEA